MCSPIADASIKDLGKQNKTKTWHVQQGNNSYRIYSEYKVLRFKVIESIKTISLGKEFHSLAELTKKELKYDTVLAKGCTRHLVNS